MGTTHRITVILCAQLLLGVAACAASDPSPAGSSLPPEAPMTAELSDFPGPFPAYGALAFIMTSTGEESIEAGFHGDHGGFVGVGGHLSRARAADLVAGRLVETTGNGDGVFPAMTFTHPSGVEVQRPVINLRLSLQSASIVQVIAQLGPAEGISTATPPGLASTATLTARGQLRLSCTIPPAPGGGTSMREDPAFSSPYCAELRTELGLDGLLAISNSI